METIVQSKIETLTLTPLVWSTLRDESDVKPVNDHDYAVLEEIRQVLEKHKAIDRFGVNLLHRHYEIQENEIMVEETDVEKRLQLIRACDKAIVENDEGTLLQTQWAFNKKGDTVCRLVCQVNNGHPRVHILVGV